MQTLTNEAETLPDPMGQFGDWLAREELFGRDTETPDILELIQEWQDERDHPELGI